MVFALHSFVDFLVRKYYAGSCFVVIKFRTISLLSRYSLLGVYFKKKKKKGPSIVDSVKVPFIILLVTCGKFICVPNNEKYFTRKLFIPKSFYNLHGKIFFVETNGA